MLDTLSFYQKKALAHVGLSILGISYGGRIKTNEPDVFALFVDFFYVDSQEEILPILQDIIISVPLKSGPVKYQSNNPGKRGQ